MKTNALNNSVYFEIGQGPKQDWLACWIWASGNRLRTPALVEQQKLSICRNLLVKHVKEVWYRLMEWPVHVSFPIILSVKLV